MTTSYPRFDGDFAGIFLKKTCEAISKKGVDVTVIAPNDEKSKDYEEAGSIKIHRFNYFFKPLQKIAYGYGGVVVNLKKNKLLYLILPFFMLSFLRKIIKISRTCDVIHANWMINGYLCVIAGMITKKPVVLTLRGKDVVQYNSKKSFYGLLGRIFLHRIKQFTSVSREFCRFLVSIGVPGGKVSFVSNGVERREIDPKILSEFKKAEGLDGGMTNIVFVGSLIRLKGIEYILKAFSRLKRADVRLYIIGEGVMKDELAELAEELGIAQKVIFTGYQPYDRIPQWLTAADIFAFSSLSEGRPNVVLEALAYGVPVVAANIPGMDEIIKDGINGLLCAPKDDISLHEKINELVENVELREKLGRGAQKFIIDEGLTWEKCAENYIKIYEKAKGA